MSLPLLDPNSEVKQIISFLEGLFAAQHKNTAVIAVSGGIDSALSLALLTKALGVQKVIPVLLPHGGQSMADAETLITHLGIPESQVVRTNIKPMVDSVIENLSVPMETVRRGNIQARMRMMVMYDLAKSHQGLVCGTENKSEHYLGYFTRYGDAASDIEPICHLYKTQVRQLVAYLHLPDVLLTKAPSAGLWAGQTDESEMGFSYDQADQVLYQLINLQRPADEIETSDLEAGLVKKVVARVKQMQFKLEVPYILTGVSDAKS